LYAEKAEIKGSESEDAMPYCDYSFVNVVKTQQRLGEPDRLTEQAGK